MHFSVAVINGHFNAESYSFVGIIKLRQQKSSGFLFTSQFDLRLSNLVARLDG